MVYCYFNSINLKLSLYKNNIIHTQETFRENAINCADMLDFQLMRALLSLPVIP